MFYFVFVSSDSWEVGFCGWCKDHLNVQKLLPQKKCEEKGILFILNQLHLTISSDQLHYHKLNSVLVYLIETYDR